MFNKVLGHRQGVREMGIFCFGKGRQARKYSCRVLIFAAAACAALAAPASRAVADPVRLTDRQMDAVTAGTTGVTIEAIAFASGSEFASAEVSTETSAYSTLIYGVAIGEAEADAEAGGDGATAEVALSTTLIVDGSDEIVSSFSYAFAYGVATEDSARASGFAFVVVKTYDPVPLYISSL